MKRLFIASVSAILCVLIGVRIYTINQEYPSVKEITVEIGETVEISGLEITPHAVEIIKADEIEGYSDPAGGSGGEEKILVFTVDFYNQTDAEIALPAYEFTAESGAWRNGLDQSAFFLMNDTDTLMKIIGPNKTASLKLGYAMYEKDVNEWEDIDNRTFTAVWLKYPIKIILKE